MNSDQNWRDDYANWLRMIGVNAMTGQGGGGTGPTSVPSGMVGQQHMGQPQQLNGNALMQPQNMQQAMPIPQSQPGMQIPGNAVHQSVMGMLGR